MAKQHWLNGVLHHLEGEWNLARSFGDLGLAVAHRDLRLIGGASIREYELGRFAQGEALFKMLRFQIGQGYSGPTSEFALAMLALALTARISGKVNEFEAAKWLSESLLSSATASPFYSLAITTSLALTAAQLGGTVAVEAHYTHLQSARGYMLFQVSADRVLRNLSMALGRFDQAVSHFEDALVFCRRTRCRPELAWTGCDYGEAFLSRGGSWDRAKAIQILERANLDVTGLGMIPLADKIASLHERHNRNRLRPTPTVCHNEKWKCSA